MFPIRWNVREHHAPVGALRRQTSNLPELGLNVREHHAPVGALRPLPSMYTVPPRCRQGAPRTCRCIELFSPRVVARGRCGGCCLLRSSGGAGFSNGGVPRPHRRARWARIGFGGGSPGGEPFPGGTGSFGGVSRSVVAPVTSWGSVQRPRGPRGRPRRTSATPLSLYYALSPSATLLFPVQQRVKRRSKEALRI